MTEILAFNVFMCIAFIMFTAKFDTNKFSLWCFRIVAILGIVSSLIRIVIKYTGLA